MGYNAILAKLLEEEANEIGPSKDRDLELIRVRAVIVYPCLLYYSAYTDI